QGRWSGQVLVMFALMLTVLIGIVGLAVDAGNLLAQRRAEQNAADAAALAGARMLMVNAPSQVRAEALSYVTRNGYATGEATVTCNGAATCASGHDQVTVQITHPGSTFFLGVLGIDSWTLTSTATARVTPDERPFALIALGVTQDCGDKTNQGITFDGGGGSFNIDITGGGVGSNGCIQTKGNSFTGRIDGSIEAYGDIVDKFGNIQTIPTAGNWVAERQSIIPDPYNDGKSPPTDLAPMDCSALGLAKDPAIDDTKDPVILQPGWYTAKSKPKLSFSGNKTIKLQSGLYCFDTDLRLNSSDTSLVSDGKVLLYFSPSGTFDPGNGNVNIVGKGSIPDNIAIWVERRDPTTLTCTKYDELKL
ncbi:MAG: hypothetical protein IRY97_11370, partial [Thermomicrobiaceae bacterium]|nr:hypothetical protein [Thermomicrobiaceae bacterium]